MDDAPEPQHRLPPPDAVGPGGGAQTRTARRRSRTLVGALAAALVLALAGCDAGAPEAAPSPTSDARIEEIRAARASVAEPAVALAQAVALVTERARALRTEVTEDREAEAGRLLDGPMDGLERAVGQVEDLELAGGEDVQRAAGALADAARAAEDVAGAADDERAEVADLVAVDATLAALVAAWEEPGSRRTQMARFDELAAEAGALADDLAERTPLQPCGGVYERRADAARTMVETTLELRDLIARYQGVAFDERVVELAADPYATDGRTLAELDAEALAACWDDETEVIAAGDRVGGALDALESALAPEDLTGTPTP